MAVSTANYYVVNAQNMGESSVANVFETALAAGDTYVATVNDIVVFRKP